jgi:NADH-quinone oxidoreductase subunit C
MQTALTHTGPTSVASAIPFLTRISQIVPPTLSTIVQGERLVKTTPKYLVPLITILKNHTGREFTQLRDVTAIDWPERKSRFEVVYSLLSVSRSRRLSVSVCVAEGEAIPSITQLYSSAGWYEREVYDRRGVPFTGHADLRPRLSDYGFRGHPLRKDFPLTGYLEVRYEETGKRLRYEPVSLAQEFRVFTLDNN